MKKSFLLLCCLLFSGVAFAQVVKFAYDPSGNRISRTIVLDKSSMEEEEAAPTLVEQLTADLQVKIYPNPTKGLLQVEITGNESENKIPIAVFNMNGQQVLVTKTAGQLSPVDLSGVPEGTYILRLTVKGKNENYTIIKK